MKRIMMAFGAFVFIAALILAVVTALGIWVRFPPTTFYSSEVSFLLSQQAIIAFTGAIIGCIFIVWARKK